MYLRLPPCPYRGDGLLVPFPQKIGRQYQVPEVRAAEDACLACQEVVDLVSCPEMQRHLRREPFEPLLVGFRQRLAGPQHPVRDPGNVLLRLADALLDLLPPRRAKRTASGKVVPLALPTPPPARVSQRIAPPLDLQMKLDARLIREGTKN